MRIQAQRKAGFSYYLAWSLASFILNSLVIGSIILDDSTPKLAIVLKSAVYAAIGFDGMVTVLLVFFQKKAAAFSFLAGASLSIPTLYIFVFIINNYALKH